MKRILEKSLNGYNEIATIEEPNWEPGPGVRNFKEFLAEKGLATHEFMLELGQVLKVPWQELVKLGDEGGFIEDNSMKNIEHYLKVRIPPVSIAFLQSQAGSLGPKNDEPWNPNYGS